MLTDKLNAIVTMLSGLPPGKFLSPWDNFPTGVTIKRGWFPLVKQYAEHATDKPTIWVTPSLTQAVTFDPDEDDRCSVDVVDYKVYVGVLKKLTTLDVADLEPASDDEIKDLADLSEQLAVVLNTAELSDGSKPDTPRVVSFIDADSLNERIFMSWWEFTY